MEIKKLLTSYLRTFLKARLPGAIKLIVGSYGRSRKITKSFGILKIEYLGTTRARKTP